MSRKREGAVRERPEDLAALLERCDTDGLRTRARMLLELQAAPQLTYGELARRLGCNEKTVRRWWSVYRGEGLHRLMKMQRLMNMEEPVTGRTRITYSYAIESEAPALTPGFLRFLNALPLALDTTEWIAGFKRCLEDILVGVDRVSVAVDVGSDLENPGSAEPTVMVTHGVSHDDGELSSTTSSRPAGSTPGESFVAQMIAEGFPSERYGRPHVFDYHLDGAEWIGTIVLWRRKGMMIPQSTLALLRALERFMVFLLTDCITRRRRSDPRLKDFQDVVRAVATSIRLTPRELEVFSLQVMGATREAIADQLGIVIGTVDKHITSIHEKAGTRNYSELFARYFTTSPGK